MAITSKSPEKVRLFEAAFATPALAAEISNSEAKAFRPENPSLYGSASPDDEARSKSAHCPMRVSSLGYCMVQICVLTSTTSSPEHRHRS
jgi:hypothetical protein